MKQAHIYVGDAWAGTLIEGEDGYSFQYTSEYLSTSDALPVSLTLPLKEEPYKDKVLFPFFDGLIPEGWLLHHAQKNYKLSPLDRMGLLLACCKDSIGNVSVVPVDTGKESDYE